MSAKNLDASGRFRSKTVGFRVSPEEWNQLEHIVDALGVSKQAYLNANMFKHTLVLTGNPRMFAGLKRQLQYVGSELQHISSEGEISSELMTLMKDITSILDRMMTAR